MWPRFGASKLVSAWITLTLAASIVAAIDGGWLASWTALVPSLVMRGQVWRLATWMFVERSPLQLLYTCVAIYKFGGELQVRWGDRRLRRFAVEVLLAAAVGTTLVGWLAGGGVLHLGGWAVGDMLVIAWARQFPERRLVFYQFIVLWGRRAIGAVVGITVLFAIYYGPIAMAPELLVCAGAYYYPRARLR